MANSFDYLDGPQAPASAAPGGDGGAQAAPPPAAKQGNSFDYLDGPQAPQQQATGGGAPGGDNGSSAFMAGIDAFNRQFGQIAEGGMKALNNVTGGMLWNPKALDQYSSNQNAAAAQSAEQHPVSSGVGTILGAIGSGAAYGAPLMAAAPASLAGTVGASAAGGGLLSGAAAYSAPGATAKDAINPALIGAATGGALGGAGYAVAPLIPSTAGIKQVLNPKAAATETLADKVIAEGGQGALDQAAQAGINTEVPQSPAETMHGGLKDFEYGALHNPEYAKQVGQAADAKDAALRPQVNQTLNQFAPDVDAAQQQVAKGYESLKQLHIPEDSLGELTHGKTPESKVINDFLGNFAEKNKYSDLLDEPNTNVAKLDQVKQDINDKLYKDSKSLGDPEKGLTESTKIAYKQAASKINSVIDSAVPEAAPTRQLAQKLIFQNKINEQIGSIAKTEGDNLSLDSIYKQIWGTTNKVDDFLSAVHQSGGDVGKAKDIIKVTGDMYKSPINKIAGKATQDSSTLGSANIGKEGVVSHLVEQLTSKRYNDALVDLMLSPNWKDQVGEALKARTTSGKFSNIVKLVGNIAGKGAEAGATGGPSAAQAVGSGVPAAGGYLQGQGVPVVPYLLHATHLTPGTHFEGYK